MSIQDLYDKAASFEAGLTVGLNCKSGCAGCCYVDLSIFEIEAGHIRQWFHALPQQSREELKQKWQAPLNAGACAFLRDEACTIYPARPLICRTQGLPFKFQEEAQEYVDICPLNEDLLEQMEERDVLNLDLLNLILGQMEKLDSNNLQRPRVPLKSLLSQLTDP